ncbi:MAG: hypothetical protein ACI9DH_001211 [Halioglobus sp.]|jgi:hypothetical protein
MKNIAYFIVGIVLLASAGAAYSGPGKAKGPKGLNPQAQAELVASGTDKYLGQFSPAASVDVGDGWTKHSFDPDGGDGPICIAGTPFSAFTRAGNPSKLLVFTQGGGACWQDFYFCNILSEQQEPPAPQVGIWDFDNKDNPFADYSIVYMPYCDGSTFTGDNDVVDANFPFGPVRFHRGLRNLSAGMDLAKTTFPNANRITVSGSSAGGVGATAFSPFLARFAYGNNTHLTVLNDAGPIAVNLNDVAGVSARAADWDFGKFYPASCPDCNVFGQPSALIDWRLDNDNSIREAFYETDGDGTNRFFTQVPTQELYRLLILGVTDELALDHPNRFKRFIVSGDASHTALQTPLFYSQDANGVPLSEWTNNFISPRKPFWVDIVEDFIPLP